MASDDAKGVPSAPVHVLVTDALLQPTSSPLSPPHGSGRTAGSSSTGHGSRDTGLYRLADGSAVSARMFHSGRTPRPQWERASHFPRQCARRCCSTFLHVVCGVTVWYGLAAVLVVVPLLLPLSNGFYHPHEPGSADDMNYWAFAYGFNLMFLLESTLLSLCIYTFAVPGVSPRVQAAMVALCLAAGCGMNVVTLQEGVFASPFVRVSAPYLDTALITLMCVRACVCVYVWMCVCVGWGVG